MQDQNQRNQLELADGATETGALSVEQIYLNCLSQASYLVADRTSKTAAIIDPRRDIDVYLKAAQKRDVSITYIILTHIHADFIAGHLELQAKTGARIYMGKHAAASFPFVSLGDGDSIDMGQVRLSALETPGHTLEAISIVARDISQDEEPKAVFTGDTLFVGDVGRPDVLSSHGIKKEDLAGMLFDSLKKLSLLPDETVLYPGHGPGSLCGKQLGSETYSTIGRQRKFNYAMRFQEKDDFVQSLCSDLDNPPPYFSFDAQMNTQNRPLLDGVLSKGLRQIDLAALRDLTARGAQLLDVRMGDQFAQGHIDGAVNVALSGKFATWSGIVLNLEKPVYVLCNPGQEREAVLRLARIGLDVAGYFNYSNLSEISNSGLLRKYQRITAEELEELLENEIQPAVLDIRSTEEYENMRIPGSTNIPLHQLPSASPVLPKDRLTVVHCQSGYRSTIAVSLLLNMGYTNIGELVGGIAETSFREFEPLVRSIDTPVGSVVSVASVDSFDPEEPVAPTTAPILDRLINLGAHI